MSKSPESFMFTVGKLDAGMAILLGERAHLIEFPSILLPHGATAGSIVNIAVHRNHVEEKRRDQEFWDLQKEIYDTFGVDTPQPPKLEVRNVTQTSVTLEWPALHLATAKLRSLDIYRNSVRLAAIPTPLQNTSTKLSGLELNTDYTFQLILRTTAGVFPSNVVRVRTHTMADTSGISVCFGTVLDKVLLEDAKQALHEMRARWSNKIQIDTTHFVCTTPAGEGAAADSGPGVEYQRALQLSIPVVQPQWILACHSERKMIPIAQFYLGATPNAPLNSAPFQRPQSMSQVSLQRSPTRGAASPPASGGGPGTRASMPPPRRSNAADNSASSFVNQSPPGSGNSRTNGIPPVSEADEDADLRGNGSKGSPQSKSGLSLPTSAEKEKDKHSRTGTMDKNFKFPPPTQEPVPPVPPLPDTHVNKSNDDDGTPSSGVEESADGETPTAPEQEEEPPMSAAPMEVPPPDPVEKETERVGSLHDNDDDIGVTEEISLN